MIDVNRSMKVFWHQSSNFGDKITPYILEKCGVKFEYTEKGISEQHYIMCGSILSACNEHSIIWGAGMAQEQEIVKPNSVLAVRGIHTRKMLLDRGIDCPEVYGDPAQILPLIYNPKIEKQRAIGIIPHVADYDKIGDWYKNKWDLNREVEETIDFILGCEQIQSSSLHAIIVAHAYGIPYIWVRSGNVIGGDFKFRDFMETEYDLQKFIEVAPFKISQE